MDTYGYTMRLLVNGKKMKEFLYNGNVFVESRHGTEYELEIKNHGSNRALAIVSVDGLCPLNGKPVSDQSPGYIIEPHNVLRVKGFQKDESSGGRFCFKENTFGSDSYAAKSGYGGNEGLIAVRIWDEKFRKEDWEKNFFRAKSWTQHPDIGLGHISGLYDSSSVDSQPDISMYGHSVNSDMGTDWGSSYSQKVKKVEFEKGNFVGEMTIRYASRKALLDMGVPVSSPPFMSYSFSQESRGFDFATPPKGWRG